MSSLVKKQNKLFPPPPSPDPTTNYLEDEVPSNKSFVELFNDLGYDKGQSWQAPDAWIAEDTSGAGYQLMKDSEIVADVLSEAEKQDSYLDEETEIQPLVTDAEACNAFETGLKCLEAQEGMDPFHLLLVKRWRDTAAQKRQQKLKQPKLTFYFSGSMQCTVPIKREA